MNKMTKKLLVGMCVHIYGQTGIVCHFFKREY